MQLSQKQKTFSELVSTFLKSIIKFEHYQKKINVIADLFPKLRAPKTVLKPNL